MANYGYTSRYKTNDEWKRPGFLSKPEGVHYRAPWPLTIVGDDGRPVHHLHAGVHHHDDGGSISMRDYVFGSRWDRSGGGGRFRAASLPPPHHHNMDPVDNHNGWSASELGQIASEEQRLNPYGRVTNDLISESEGPLPLANMFGDHEGGISSSSSTGYQLAREGSVTIPTIDSREAARKYGGYFVW